jgi:toxin YoeB
MARRRPGTGTGTRKARNTIIQDECMEDLAYWVRTDRKTALRIFDLMKAVRRDPFRGLGKPEPLKHLGSDIWSRRITARDRLVYRVLDDCVDFLQARFHY